MKKKYRAAAFVFSIMISVASLPLMVTAGQEEGMSWTDSSDTSEEVAGADSVPDAPDVISLQIPQKLGIVIDPWEMDGRGQIYSEQYTIRNTGEVAGVLTLSFLCRRGENSIAIIRTDKAGLHDDENKSIYIEMLFGDTDRMVLSEEGLEYQAELEPGEELAVSFAGEVNENASESWGNGDVEIEGIYSWSVLEDADTETEADMAETEEALNPEEDDSQGETEADGEEESDSLDSLPVESSQDQAESEAEESSEALPEEKETLEQETDNEDMTEAEAQEADQNPEIDNAEDDQEG